MLSAEHHTCIFQDHPSLDALLLQSRHGTPVSSPSTAQEALGPPAGRLGNGGTHQWWYSAALDPELLPERLQAAVMLQRPSSACSHVHRTVGPGPGHECCRAAQTWVRCYGVEVDAHLQLLDRELSADTNVRVLKDLQVGWYE